MEDDVRDIELSLLKSKISKAIRFSERYWMIYKQRSFGIATIIDLTYKKSYIEWMLKLRGFKFKYLTVKYPGKQRFVLAWL